MDIELIAVPRFWPAVVFIGCDRCGLLVRAQPWMDRGYAGECYRCMVMTYSSGYDLPF